MYILDNLKNFFRNLDLRIRIRHDRVRPAGHGPGEVPGVAGLQQGPGRALSRGEDSITSLSLSLSQFLTVHDLYKLLYISHRIVPITIWLPDRRLP